MTREQFDKVRWHKGMRCAMAVMVRPGQAPKILTGEVVGVSFGGYWLRIRWDGRDYLSEKLPCERIELETE